MDMESEGDEVTFLPYRKSVDRWTYNQKVTKSLFYLIGKSVDRWTWNQKVTKSLFYGIVCNRTRDAV